MFHKVFNLFESINTSDPASAAETKNSAVHTIILAIPNVQQL